MARPFPYASWPKLTRRQLQLLRALRAHWDRDKAEHALAVARELFGREVALTLGIGESCSAQQLATRAASTPGLALLIEQTHGARPLTCAVELSHHAAQQIVDLVLGGDPMQAMPPNLVPVDELSRGALAYATARVLAALGGWSLRDISELSHLGQQLREDCVVCPITLPLGPTPLTLRAYVPERLALQDLPERKPQRNLAKLRVDLLAFAGVAHLTASVARDLQTGDVLILDETSLVEEQAKWRGRCQAGLMGGRHLLECEIQDASLRIESVADGKEHGMSTGHVNKAPEAGAASLASDTPIELQVELARFSLSLGELQRLQAGDVLVTGRRIGERVRLHVGGQSFAEGELVDVDGEVGVRLLAFSNQSERSA